MTAPTVAVVLAAGAGSRFRGGVHKLLTVVDGSPLVTRAVDAAVAADVGPVIVVEGAVELRPVLPRGVTVIRNAEWSTGLASSLQVGLQAAAAHEPVAALVGLGDQPWIPAEAWRAVSGAAAPLAVALYDGRRGHPVRVARSLWSLLPTSGDDGARELLRRRAADVEEVPCPGDPADIDTAEDLPDAADLHDPGGGFTG